MTAVKRSPQVRWARKCTMADADLFLDMMAGLQHLDLPPG